MGCGYFISVWGELGSTMGVQGVEPVKSLRVTRGRIMFGLGAELLTPRQTRLQQIYINLSLAPPLENSRYEEQQILCLHLFKAPQHCCSLVCSQASAPQSWLCENTMSWRLLAEIMGHVRCAQPTCHTGLGYHHSRALTRLGDSGNVRRSRFRRPYYLGGGRGYFKVRCGMMEEEGVFLRNKYDAAVNSVFWETRPVMVTARLIQIGIAFGSWYLRSKLTGTQQKAASELRTVLTHLGPAFVKIGQAVSSRPDVMPPTYLAELEKLQDRIPPFESAAAFETIQQELGRPANEVFASISDAPVAAASLGQVYKATLMDSRETVAVKVQRPGVIDQISLDVYILRKLAAAVRGWRKVNSDLPALVDEWSSSLFRELDYTQEARNGARFSGLFGEMKGVYIPKMYEDLTTPKVLVMEWVDGDKLRTGTSAAANENGLGTKDDLRLVSVGVVCSLEQMLEEGFYHADPHPGNLLRMPDGQLCYLDFGMMGEIGKATRQALIRATLHLVNQEFNQLAEDFVTLGFLPPGADKEEIVPALTGVFQKALAGGMSNLSFGDLSVDLGQTMYKYKFQIPAYYTLLVRSLTVLEGIAIASDPKYKVLSAAYPWVARRLLTDKSVELRDTLRTLLYKKNKFQFHRLEALLTQAVRSPERGEALPVVLDSTKGEDGVITGRPLQFLLTEEGEFVRDILTDEMAKGIDAGWRLGLDNVVEQTRHAIIGSLSNSPWSVNGVDGGPVAGIEGVMQAAKALLEFPEVADEQDKEQVEGIWRLAQAMQKIADRQDTSKTGPGLSSITEAAMALSWLVQEFDALPQGARQAARQLPVVLFQKVASRILARGIRASLGESPPDDNTSKGASETKNVPA